MLNALPPARRRLILGLAAGLAVLLVLALATALRARGAQAVPVSQAVQGPVLLVPGYGGSTDALEVLATALRAAGRTVEVVAPVGDGTGDLVAQATNLQSAVDAALARTGAPSVDIVGYSAGGVVARLWVADLDGGSQARRVVTLGSPHHGTDVAGLAAAFATSSCPLACQQLAPDSDLLGNLNEGDETPDGPLWASLWTNQDQTVIPPESAELEGAVNFSVQSVCASSTVTHSDLPRDPNVIALTIEQLGIAPPNQPPAKQC